MNAEEVNAELRELENDRSAKSSVEIDAMLQRLTAVAVEAHSLPAGDQQATVTKTDHLRRELTDWYNDAVEHESKTELTPE